MNQTWKNDKKTPSFRLDFGPFNPNLDPEIFFVDFSSTRCYALLQAMIICNFKEN